MISWILGTSLIPMKALTSGSSFWRSVAKRWAMQPATRSFWPGLIEWTWLASRMASTDSLRELSRNPQVLMITTSASAWLGSMVWPALRSVPSITSESTRFFAHPRLRRWTDDFTGRDGARQAGRWCRTRETMEYQRNYQTVPQLRLGAAVLELQPAEWVAWCPCC